MTRLQPLRPLAVLLAAGAVAAPAATARPFHDHVVVASSSIAARDVRSVDAHHAALVQRDLRAAAPTSSLAGTSGPPAYRDHPVAATGDGIDATPLAGGLAVVAAAFGVGVALHRRQARPAT